MKRLEIDPKSIEFAWTAFAQSIGGAVPIRSRRRYAHAAQLLNALPDAEPRDVLRLLMETNGLTQTNLGDELGGQSVVSVVLNGKRPINARQARALAERFGQVSHLKNDRVHDSTSQDRRRRWRADYRFQT